MISNLPEVKGAYHLTTEQYVSRSFCNLSYPAHSEYTTLTGPINHHVVNLLEDDDLTDEHTSVIEQTMEYKSQEHVLKQSDYNLSSSSSLKPRAGWQGKVLACLALFPSGSQDR